MSTEARSAEETRGPAAWRAPDVIPGLSYEDAPAAIDWLERAFGFERHAVHEGEGGKIVHAELRVGSGMVMLGSEREGAAREHFPVTTPPRRAPSPPASTSSSTTPTRTTSGRRPRARRS